jgi:hypothetical protein
VDSDGYVLLAITTKNPSAKIAATPSLAFGFNWSRVTMVMGKQMMMTSLQMLTETVSVCVNTMQMLRINVQKMVIQ